MSEALYLTGGKEAFETAYFISKIDKFFDCLNVRHYLQGKHVRKSFLQPYRSKTDFRFDVSYNTQHFIVVNHPRSTFSPKFLKKEFLPYFAAWKKSVSEREGYSNEAKSRMMLSQQTLTGIEITGMYVCLLFFACYAFMSNLYLQLIHLWSLFRNCWIFLVSHTSLVTS